MHLIGNLYGLRERVVAAASLMGLAEELQRAKGPLMALLGPADTNAVEQFYQVRRRHAVCMHRW